MVKAKGRVLIATDQCKGCGLCISLCPLGIIVLDTAAVNAKGYVPARVTEASSCIGCGNCGTICPDSVITVERFVKQGRAGK
jgi:2-oxoglutarate ferredoxin oxidoreductase subunit delta